MKNLNSINLSGRLGRDFELRQTPAGTAVTENALAVTTGFGDKEATTWIPLVFWGKLAESAAAHLGKGRECLIKGRIEQETWIDKDNKKQHKLKVVVEDWGFIGPKPDGSGTLAQAAVQAFPARPGDTGQNDDIPF